jgi:hypothetical protein
MKPNYEPKRKLGTEEHNKLLENFTEEFHHEQKKKSVI